MLGVEDFCVNGTMDAYGTRWLNGVASRVVTRLNACYLAGESKDGFPCPSDVRGLAAANNVLIIAGSLVGASGLILTQIMCTSMNRSLFDVVFGSMGSGGTVMDVDEVELRERLVGSHFEIEAVPVAVRCAQHLRHEDDNEIFLGVYPELGVGDTAP